MYDLILIVGYTALAIILAVILAAAIVDPDDLPK
jgi:hypothetical protein